MFFEPQKGQFRVQLRFLRLLRSNHTKPQKAQKICVLIFKNLTT